MAMKKRMIKLKAKSQYDASVNERYQSSACGPTAVEAILQHYLKQPVAINYLYKALGTTPIGLFTWRMIRRLKHLLGPNWQITRVTKQKALAAIDAGEPIALKFDRYFTPFFFKKARYNYHWTVLVNYAIEEGRLQLFVQDLGTRSRESRIEKIDYLDNAHALTFVHIKPLFKNI